MLKKVLGLASLLLLITFLGAACAPAASQKDLQELQYQVQALNLSLATTQNNLQATQEALRNMQVQNQQLQNQIQQTSTECSTCDKTAQDCIDTYLINPYGCVVTSPYYYNPCPSPCSPIGYSPSWFWPYFFPHPDGTHCGPTSYYPPVNPCPCPNPCPSPCPPPCPPPCPCPDPYPQSVTFVHPAAIELTGNIPAIEPMATDVVITTTPPAVTTYTTPFDLPERVLKIKPPILSVPEPPATTVAEPLSVVMPEPVTYPTTQVTISLPELTPEPVLVTIPSVPAAVNYHVTMPEPVMYPTTQVTIYLPEITPEPVVVTIPAVPATVDYPIITRSPSVPEPPISETLKDRPYKIKGDPT